MSLPYVPDPLGTPQTMEELVTYLNRELERVSVAIGTRLPQQLEVLYAEPEKKRELMLVFADGVHWNPGFGRGWYIWAGGGWHLVGSALPGQVPGDETPPSGEEPPAGGGDPGGGPSGDPPSNLPVEGLAEPTFHSCSLTWVPPTNPGTAGAVVEFRTPADTGTWVRGYNMWFDPRDKQCRGSLVHLQPDTEYEVRFSLVLNTPLAQLRFRTWAPPPEDAAKTIINSTAPFTITVGGTPTAWKVYEPATGLGPIVQTSNWGLYAIRVEANYVVVRGFKTEGGEGGISIASNFHHVMIESCDISKWAVKTTKVNAEGWIQGGDSNCGIGIGTRAGDAPLTTHIIIQKCKVHKPSWGAFSWSDGHPHGPLAVGFFRTGGNTVIRWNEFIGGSDTDPNDPSKYYHDIIGGPDNFSAGGCPGPNVDIYGNIFKHCWDDAVSTEGGGKNVRVWNNYLDRVAVPFASTVVHLGPLYYWRNVINRTQMDYRISSLENDSRRGPAFKARSTLNSWGGGRRYIFHNTFLQHAGSPSGLGVGSGIAGGTNAGAEEPLTNTVSRNNILHVWRDTAYSIRAMSQQKDNDLNYDLYNGRVDVPGAEANGLRVASSADNNPNNLQVGPVYKAGHGPTAEAGGRYQLEPTSPGANLGEVLFNFNDAQSPWPFSGTAPDAGAHEDGAADMTFGVSSTAR